MGKNKTQSYSCEDLRRQAKKRPQGKALSLRRRGMTPDRTIEELQKTQGVLETRVEERTQVLDAFFRHTITPLVILDKNFNFIRVNEAYANACGRKVSEFAGHNHFEFYPHKENEEIFREVVRTKKPYGVYARPFSFPDHPEWGTTYWDWTLSPILDERGEVNLLVFSLEDVTAKTLADMKLRQNEEKYRQLVENANSIILQSDRQGKITFFNEYAQKFFGYSEEEILGRNAIGTIVPEVDSSGRNLKKLMKNICGHPELYEHNENENMCKKGRRVWISWTNKVIKDEHGRAAGLLAIGNDITYRKRQEAYSRVTNSLLKLFIDKTSRRNYLDSAVKVIRNWSGCDAVGIRLIAADCSMPYEASAGLSREFLDAENSPNARNNPCICVRIISDPVRYYDESVITKKGSFRCGNIAAYMESLEKKLKKRVTCSSVQSGFTSVALVPIVYKGQMLGAIYLADRREGKIAAELVELLENLAPLVGEAIYRFDVERKLSESREYLQSVVASAPVILIAADKDGIITLAEGSGLRVAPDRLKKLLGRDVFKDFPEFEEAMESVRSAMNGETSHIEITLPDGLPLDVFCSPIRDSSGGITGATAVAIDITERRQAEEKIKAYEAQLRSLTAELLLTEERERRKVAESLHDSIGPLLSFSERELGMLEKTVPEKVARSLQEVRRYINDAVRQTRSLTFDLSPSSLYDLGFEAAVEELVEQFAGERKLKFFFKNSEQSKPLANEAKILLFRSVREVLINAIKHSHADTVWITLTRAGGNIEVIVRDNGEGFDASKLDEQTSKSRGFGLFSIRERLTHIGGQINIESQRGKGTKIRLLAPLDLSRETEVVNEY